MDLARCIDGDPTAWDEFVTRYASIIFNTVLRTLAKRDRFSDADAHDITQDVFVKLLNADCRLLRSYDSQRADLEIWLTVIARSTALDAMRRVRSVVSLTEEPAVSAPSDSENRETPVLPMELLSPRQQQVMRMSFEEEMSVSDIAAKLQINDQTVRSTRHAALTLLRQYFGAPPKQR